MDETPVDEGTEGENPGNTDPMDECLSDSPILEDSEKDLSALTDMYWVYLFSYLSLFICLFTHCFAIYLQVEF